MTTATFETRLTSTLDEIEERLPALPASLLRLERSIAGRTYDTVAGAVGNLRGSLHTVGSRTDRAARTVVGTGRRAIATTFDAARVGAKTTVGQTRAQASKVGDAVTAEATDIHDDALGAVKTAIRAVDPDDDASTGYERWAKTDLYDRATELDVEGRSTMTKAELIDAIRDR
ncbi:MAG: Rho termination factor N-terminal domain-containing protein [Acidimicrobiales bacterium]